MKCNNKHQFHFAQKRYKKIYSLFVVVGIVVVKAPSRHYPIITNTTIIFSSIIQIQMEKNGKLDVLKEVCLENQYGMKLKTVCWVCWGSGGPGTEGENKENYLIFTVVP